MNQEKTCATELQSHGDQNNKIQPNQAGLLSFASKIPVNIPKKSALPSVSLCLCGLTARYYVNVLVLLVALLLPGCNDVKPTRIGETVTPFKLAGLAGNMVDTASGRGRVQVIYFWNDQCGCVEQLAQLHGFVASKQESSLSFITVNVGQGKGEVEEFVRRYDLPYTVLLDSDRAIATKHVGIKVLPTILVIDKGGILREKLMGIVMTKKLEEVISRYL